MLARRLVPTALLFAVPLAGQGPSKAAPVFVDGQAQVVPAFADSSTWIRQELWVETTFDTDGDGRLDRVHVDVTRPGPTATERLKVPVIYETSPYFAGTSGAREFLWDVHQEVGGPPPPRTSQPPVNTRSTSPRISNSQVRDWVPRGFAVVHSESPGTGLSQGCPTVGGPNEELAPKAVIDWLNGRARGYTAPVGGDEVTADWTTGKVGMTGTSYNGTLPVAAAITGVEGLEAIIPIAPNTSYYTYYRSNGLVRHPGGWLGEDIDFLYDFINSGDPSKREYCNRTVRDGEMAAKDRVTGDWNAFWAARDYWPRIDNIKAATLMAHAFNDWNVMPIHSVYVAKRLQRNGVPVQMYFHQGGHGGPPPLELMNRWFTRYLYDVQNGVENDPKAWIVREGDARDKPTPYPDYPLPDAAGVTLHPTGGGNGVGGLSMSAPATPPVETLTDLVDSSSIALAQMAQSEHRLVYATPELTQPLHISGTPRVTVRVAVNKPAANLTVYLVALPYDEPQRGRPDFSLVTRGWADLQNRNSLEQGEPLVPGEFYEMTFDLMPDDQVIPAGKRLALMVFSSDRDFTLWPEPGTELQVDLAGTAISIPVVGGPAAFAAATTTP